MLTANPEGLAAGNYSATIHVQGPINSIDIPADLLIAGVSSVTPVTLTMFPSSVAFTVEAGQGQVGAGQLVNTNPALFTFTQSRSRSLDRRADRRPRARRKRQCDESEAGELHRNDHGDTGMTLQNIPIAPSRPP